MKNYTKQQIMDLAINLKREQIPCKLLKINGELDIILGTNYPEELGAQVFSIIKNLNIEANIVGSATYYKNNPKVEMELNVYGGPKDYINPGKDYISEKFLRKLIREEIKKEVFKYNQ